MKSVSIRVPVAKRTAIVSALFTLGLSALCSKPPVPRASAGERPPGARPFRDLAASIADPPDEPPPVDPIRPASEAERDALHTTDLVRSVRGLHGATAAANAIDGDADTAWRGETGASDWRWRVAFRRPVHVSLLRATWGKKTTVGIPTTYRWEAWRALPGATCEEAGEPTFEPIADAQEETGKKPGEVIAYATRRSWFVDTDACGLRLVVSQTNDGSPPVLRELFAYEGAKDVLRDGEASADSSQDGYPPEAAIDGTYERRWTGEPGRGKWTLEVALREPAPIDRVRVVLGFDATAHTRSSPTPGIGRTYAIAWAPVQYTIEGTEDGKAWFPVATTPKRADGSTLPLRRRLVRLAKPRTVRALRVVMVGATDVRGVPDAAASPVIRELAAYRADDPHPVLPAPWILSVNANPAVVSHSQRGAELANDIYFAKFLHVRWKSIFPQLARDDRFSRSLGPRGELLVAARSERDGEVLESIEADDEMLEPELLEESSPPPITVLSGSNDWEYGPRTEWDVTTGSKRWHWDPLPDARRGGMGQLHRAVKARSAPLLGFCGGAQILALLEAKTGDGDTSDQDLKTIDAVLRRTTGRPIRGYAKPAWIERAWPYEEPNQREEISFEPDDMLFRDIAGTDRRVTTRAFPEQHADVVRPDAFLPGAPLERFAIVAKSQFCGEEVVDAGPRDEAMPNPAGVGRCVEQPEVFRAKEGRYPVIGAQFHAEQREFPTPAPGDPPESISDPKLFVHAAFEETVDAYIRNAQ